MGSTDQKRAFLAVILSGIVLFGWQALVVPKFAPEPSEAPVTTTSTETLSDTKSTISKASESSKTKPEVLANTAEPAADLTNVKTYRLSRGENTLEINNQLRVSDFSNPNQVEVFEKITGKNPFQIQIIRDGKGLIVPFSMTQINGYTLEGENTQLGIRFSGVMDENGKLAISLTSQNEYLYRLSFESVADDLGNNRLRQYVAHFTDVERFEVGSAETFDGKLNFVGIDHYYHLFAFAFEAKSLAALKSYEKGQMTVDMAKPTRAFIGSLVYTKKNYDHLVKLGDNLELSVDFGFFGILAIPILRGLQFFYKYFPNYGIAIILLTLVIRLITFPLQYKSFKSMKKMQVVQPELQKLREKFKDDPQRMQKETMELFKKAGANPLGGCLPMLLQMPVFFAFYQVLYNAVELVGAPFYFWIYDLSEKDPYYVLPVLMGLSMFGQTKLNPTTSADPTQQKVMLFMPLIFTFIMKDFPAGLNLYIFISTLFGIVQQLFVYKTTD